ncbi:TRAP transporter substrate-binding protein [Brevibacillus fulvus]|uniref:Tripartite ATP-independent transporter DctP family solute receptor n=1 Tax=Brevibacillus fulvus TaxID=1125967 RepID=A0A938Y0C2_9BACL|nr:TRAP transporter substrate-binding protein [Brevibacillus fulvus]MBM7589227.1 tripartite ATP-independent transporter DctP family solute receptor [Brevibacillus fulvus]
MNKKKSLMGAVATLLLAGSVLAGCSSSNTASPTPDGGSENSGASGPQYTFRLADTHPPDYPTVIGDQKFADLVNERTNGRIKIEIFPSGQLGEEKAVLEQVQLGAIEFARTNAAPLAEFNEELSILSLPYIFDNDEHLWRFLEGEMGNKMLDDLEQSRMKGLAYYSSGARSFYSRKPLTSIEDLKGQKFRVQQTKVNIDLIEALGASATPMGYGEVFSALQTGVIDGAENNFPSYYSSNHYQVAKNVILDTHQRTPEVLLISKSAWDKLSEEDKKIVKQAALDSVSTQRESWEKWEKESAEKLKAAGVTITEVTDLKPWQDAVKSVVEKHGSKYQEILDAVDKARQ